VLLFLFVPAVLATALFADRSARTRPGSPSPERVGALPSTDRRAPVPNRGDRPPGTWDFDRSVEDAWLVPEGQDPVAARLAHEAGRDPYAPGRPIPWYIPDRGRSQDTPWYIPGRWRPWETYTVWVREGGNVFALRERFRPDTGHYRLTKVAHGAPAYRWTHQDTSGGTRSPLTFTRFDNGEATWTHRRQIWELPGDDLLLTDPASPSE